MGLRSSRRFDPRLVCLAILLSIPAVVVPVTSCGGDSGNHGTNGLGGGGSTPTTSNGGAGATSAGGSGGEGGGIHRPDGGCEADCKGGVCLDDGTCCEDPKNVCADACCVSGTVCLFDACVKPGKECHTTKDCGDGQYCETALGGDTPDAGADAACTQPPPLQGHCLPRPAVCAPDAGADAGCIANCEYHPPVGQLDAVPRWKWDDTNAVTLPAFTDIWATPTVGRVYDANCDGKIDDLDPPNVIFVSGNSTDNSPGFPSGLGNCCQCSDRGNQCSAGVLRMLDGRTGKEIWSLENPAGTMPVGGPLPPTGFAGLSVALGDIDGDGRIDIIAATGDGHVVMVDATGHVVRTSNTTLPGATGSDWGWGGGLSIADMDGDGFPEIAYGATVFSTKNNTITKLWSGTWGTGGAGTDRELSTFVDLDGDGILELLAGCTAYRADGTMLWNRCPDPGISDGFSAVADFDGDGKPDVVLVSAGKVYVFDGATGATKFGPVTLAGGGSGGPPTVADFNGDGEPEIGVAQQNFYYMLKPDKLTHAIDVIWFVQNHDLSSSVTGSSVFDFEGDGKAEVIYADECFLWVFDGATGAVRFATPHTSFTATESSLVADVDGDGHAEMLMVSNSANPGTTPANSNNTGWKCQDESGVPVTLNGITWAPGPYQAGAYRGLVLFGDQASSWVGTRTLWNQHTYHVSNICDDRDNACPAPNVYGSIPKQETANWSLPWLNNFRQNVQDKGIFDAPDATVTLKVDCNSPVVAHPSVRNIGLASLPAGVNVGIFRKKNGAFTEQVAEVATDHALFPGQTQALTVHLPGTTSTDVFVARILVDAQNPTFHECRDDNDESAPAKAPCAH